eukprot:Opistho-2@51484
MSSSTKPKQKDKGKDKVRDNDRAGGNGRERERSRSGGSVSGTMRDPSSSRDGRRTDDDSSDPPRGASRQHRRDSLYNVCEMFPQFEPAFIIHVVQSNEGDVGRSIDILTDLLDAGDAFSNLCAIFGQLDPGVVQDTLAAHRGSLPKTTKALLELADAVSPRQLASSKSISSGVDDIPQVTTTTGDGRQRQQRPQRAGSTRTEPGLDAVERAETRLAVELQEDMLARLLGSGAAGEDEDDEDGGVYEDSFMPDRRRQGISADSDEQYGSMRRSTAVDTGNRRGSHVSGGDEGQYDDEDDAMDAAHHDESESDGPPTDNSGSQYARSYRGTGPSQAKGASGTRPARVDENVRMGGSSGGGMLPPGRLRGRGEGDAHDEDDEGVGGDGDGEADGDVDGDGDGGNYGEYNPDEFANLPVSSEIRELFEFIRKYNPIPYDPPTQLRCFIPDLLPAIGDIDPFVKVDRPDGVDKLRLGLLVIDEPAAKQADPTALDLTLRALSKNLSAAPVLVRSIADAGKAPQSINEWIRNVEAVHKTKPPSEVVYKRPMPDIEGLMQPWPPEMEEMLESLSVPSSELNVSLSDYTKNSLRDARRALSRERPRRVPPRGVYALL